MSSGSSRDGRARSAYSFEAASLDPLEELDLLAGSECDNGLAPARDMADDAAPTRAARLRLRALRQHVDCDDRDLLGLVESLDRGLDLDLVRVGMDPERVLAAARLVDRLLADDRPEDDVRGADGAHR